MKEPAKSIYNYQYFAEREHINQGRQLEKLRWNESTGQMESCETEPFAIELKDQDGNPIPGTTTIKDDGFDALPDSPNARSWDEAYLFADRFIYLASVGICIVTLIYLLVRGI